MERLVALETAIEKEQNSIRYYTPAAPIIGLNATTGAHPSSYNRESYQYAPEMTMAVAGEEEEEVGVVDEYQEMESDNDHMEELEDSTGSPLS